jgi:glucose/arabinose dehydrogenase
MNKDFDMTTHSRSVFSIFVMLSLLLLLSVSSFTPCKYLQRADAAYVKSKPEAGGPVLTDPNLKVEVVFENSGELDAPTTSMAFLGPDDILVLEKNQGTVQRIVNGHLQSEPLLQVRVGNEVEWGMLGVATTGPATTGKTYVFLYYTEADNAGGVLGNRLYRYELVNDKLVNPLLLLDLPAIAPPGGEENNHDGGKVEIGPDGNVYVVIGDVGGRNGQAQNNNEGDALDGTSGILRVTQDGQPVGEGIIGKSIPQILYYAYGIRNSFGFDFDPVTGNVWDTENGANDKDEINLVKPGFNSGWSEVMGFPPKRFNAESDLVNFNGNGQYSDPQFVWRQTTGPTALQFLRSTNLGAQYENTIFVGDVNTGNLYNFKLNPDRTSLLLQGPLSDRTADTPEEEQSLVFGTGFGVITDIKTGPDGNLYVLGFDGTIYRIS